MAEMTINDTQMVLCTLHPDGPVDGVPQWSVVSGNSTLLSDPSHADWDASLPDGYQMFLVSETLAADEPGPVDTVYHVEADVEHGEAVELLTEDITLHVLNRTTTLGISMKPAVAKP